MNSSRKMFPAADEVLEGPLWEALWPPLCVPEVLQMRVTAQAWTDAGKYEPYCELFFFLMRREPDDETRQRDAEQGQRCLNQAPKLGLDAQDS